MHLSVSPVPCMHASVCVACAMHACICLCRLCHACMHLSVSPVPCMHACLSLSSVPASFCVDSRLSSLLSRLSPLASLPASLSVCVRPCECECVSSVYAIDPAWMHTPSHHECVYAEHFGADVSCVAVPRDSWQSANLYDYKLRLQTTTTSYDYKLVSVCVCREYKSISLA
jgi:hypothetical protein